MEFEKTWLGISDLLILMSAVGIYFVIGEQNEVGSTKVTVHRSAAEDVDFNRAIQPPGHLVVRRPDL